MEAYPLVFTFRDIVAGEGFFARIVAHGRVIMTLEGDGYWMSGINPGAIAAGGSEIPEALRAFKERYLSVLFDIADEATTFDAFSREVRWFFETVDPDAEAEWLAAREKVRAGELGNIGDLRRSTDSDFSISVHLLVIGRPGDNSSVDYAEAA